jgi:small conductance mechanosensitive channel
MPHFIKRPILIGIMLGLAVLTALTSPIMAPPPSLAQLGPLPTTGGNSLPVGVEQQGTLETAAVKLDGKTLFRIASPAVPNRSEPGERVPVEIRAGQVQGNLQRLLPDGRHATNAITPDGLNVVVETVNGFPVLFAQHPELSQSRALLTVTAADAQYYSLAPEELAYQWQDELEQKLRQAIALRQPEAIRRQLKLFFRVLIGTILVTLFLGIAWMLLGRREKRLWHQRQIQRSVMQVQEASSVPAPEPCPQKGQGQRQLFGLQRRLQIVRFVRWLNFWFIAFSWAFGTAYALRLFPQTRQIARKLVIAPLVLLVAWFVIGLINRLVDLAVDQFVQRLAESQALTTPNLQRINTIAKVVKGVKMVAIYTIGVLLVLQWLELVPGSVLALGTLVALVISFAAQNLIRDLVNGFLILLEDQYRIGDVVNIGEKGGLVENFNLRITQLRNPDGHLITVPNSSIVEVENLSRDWSRSDFRIEVAYDTDVDFALAIVRDTAEKMAQDPDWRDVILDTHEFFGVEYLSHQGMVIRIWIKTAPIQQWVVAMELRRRLKKAFDLHGIRIGTPQQFWLQNGNGKGTLIKPAQEVEERT